MMKSNESILGILACEIDKRPKDAPWGDEVFPQATGMERHSDALDITFTPEAAPKLSAFVQAEQLCCAGIGWEITDGPEPRLRITATSEQLDLFEQIIATAGK
jgi:hypothetical protein